MLESRPSFRLISYWKTLQMVQDTRIIPTRAAMKTAWSALRELPDAQPWTA